MLHMSRQAELWLLGELGIGLWCISESPPDCSTEVGFFCCSLFAFQQEGIDLQCVDAPALPSFLGDFCAFACCFPGVFFPLLLFLFPFPGLLVISPALFCLLVEGSFLMHCFCTEVREAFVAWLCLWDVCREGCLLAASESRS